VSPTLLEAENFKSISRIADFVIERRDSSCAAGLRTRRGDDDERVTTG
jgi:hypothetical protein